MRTVCTDGLPARQIPAHERFVDDGDERTAQAIADIEVPAVPQRYAHRLEPSGRRRVAPEPRPAAVLLERGAIADADRAAPPPAAGQTSYPRRRSPTSRLEPPRRRRADARHADARSSIGAPLACRFSSATSSGSGTKPSGNRLRDANVRRKSPAATTRTSDTAICATTSAPRAAKRRSPAIPRPASLSASPGRDALQPEHRRNAGDDRRQAGEGRREREDAPVERKVQRHGALPRAQLLHEECTAPRWRTPARAPRLSRPRSGSR